MDEHKYLITGIGGDIGFGLVKIIKEYTDFVYGVDIHDFHPGKSICKNCFIVPRFSDEDYLEKIKEIVTKYEIDILIPGSHLEIEYYQYNNINQIGSNCKIIMANNGTFKIFNDKYLTIDFLRKHNFPYPKTDYLDNLKVEYVELPCVIKKSKGRGGKDVTIVDDTSTLMYLFETCREQEYIVQEFIEDCDQEFTCCVFRSKKGHIKTLIINRKLQGEITGKGRVVRNEKINDLIIKIAEKIDLYGSINIQLRTRNEVPYIFEINPRFSSTLVFRDVLGFKDVVWSILDELCLLQNNKVDLLNDYKDVKENIRFCVMPNQYIIS